MKNYYIAKNLQMPLFFFLQTCLWLLVITIPVAIVLRIIHDIIAGNMYEKNKDKSIITVEDDGVLVNYKKINKKILFKDIIKVSSSHTVITRFTFGGTRGFGFAIETSNKTYGKLRIETNNEIIVLKYIEFVKLAEEEINQFIA